MSASGFLAELDRMNLEVREYLWSHPSQLAEVSPVGKTDPIFNLGKNPVECGLPDGSEQHERNND